MCWPRFLMVSTPQRSGTHLRPQILSCSGDVSPVLCTCGFRRAPIFNNMASQDIHTCLRGISNGQMCIALVFKDLSLFPVSFFTPQINGIALDNKSVTECEALLRSCRDSLSLSLMKVCHTHHTFSFTYATILHELSFHFSMSDVAVLQLQLNYLMKCVHLMWLIPSSELPTVLPSQHIRTEHL